MGRPNDELHARSTSAVYDDGRDFQSGRLAKRHVASALRSNAIDLSLRLEQCGDMSAIGSRRSVLSNRHGIA